MKKLFKYLFILIMSFSIIGVLSSCGKKGDDNPPVQQEEKVVPIYQGVSIDAETNKENVSLAGTSEDDRNEMINKDFGIVVTDEISYFSTKEQRQYITLNFYNPSQFEILSFVLNGTKYQSYQFTEDSTSDKIRVAITMPNTSGIIEYNIEQIKYIDGQAIKDCKIDGNTSVKVGVLYDTKPFTVTDVLVDYDSVTITNNIVDAGSVVEANKGEFRLYVFDELGIVKKETLKLGENNTVFNDLKVNKEYIYTIVASLDFLDGKGMRTFILKEDVFKTKDYINISNTIETETSLGLTINKNFDNVKIEKVELFKNNVLVNTTNDETVSFTGLYSNTEYLVKVTYSYNNLKYETVINLKTKPMEAPTVSVELTPNKKSINYNVYYQDKYNILKVNKIELIKNGVAVQTKQELTGEFTNLLSNNDYEVKVYYSYNLNEGLSDITEEITNTTHTNSLSVPTVGVNLTNGTTLVNGSLVISDIDNTLIVESINLYKESDSSLIGSLNNTNEFGFDVIPNVDYKIIVSYSYNLNDGNPAISKTYETKFTTHKVVPTISVEMSNITDKSAVCNISTSDNNSTGQIKSIKLYKNDTFIKDVSLVDYLINDLVSNTDYTVKVVYVYDLNDGTGSHEITETATFKTLKVMPVVNIKEDITTTSIKINPEILDIDSAGKLTKVELLLNNEVKATLTENYLFEELLSNTKYVVRLYYEYDLNTGIDTLKVTKEITTTKKAQPIVDVTLSSDKKSLTYEVTYSDKENTYKLENVEIIKSNVVLNSLSTSNGTLSNLLSNNEYEVKVTYSYDLNEGKGRTTSTISKTIKTLSLQEPIIGVKITNISSTVLEGTLTTIDVDNILKVNNIKLYLAENLINSVYNANNFSFEVNANVTYKLEVSYSYDLNDGNGTVNGVYETLVTTHKETPTINVSVTSITSSDALVVVTNSDNNSTGNIKSIKLYKNGLFIKDVSLVDYNLTNLLSNTEYMVEVTYVYDLNDGTGSHEIVESSSFKTLKVMPSVSIKEDVTTTSIKVNPEVIDLDSAGKINKVELLLNNEVVETLTENYLFENLLSNTKYVVRLYYEYNLNTSDDELKVTKEIITTKKAQPVVDVTLTSDKQTVSYEVSYTDKENTFNLENVEIIKSNVVISSSNELISSFNNLLFNNEYEVKVTYSFDLNEGRGRTTSSISKTIKTMSLQEPKVGIKIFNLTSSLLEGNLSIVDSDNTLSINNIKLYMGDNLLDTVYGSNDFSFSVSSNVSYKLVVSYSYNLLDGEGIHETEYTLDVTSLKEEPRIIFTPYYIGQNTVEYNLLISDNNVTGRVNLIALYEGNNYVTKLDENTVKLDNLKSNTNYTLKVNYVYDFDDGYGSREVNEEYNFKTLKVVPELELLYSNTTKNSIEVEYDINDVDAALTFDKIELYLNNELVKSSLSINDTLFNELLSNTTYRVVSYFNCDLNNGSYQITRSIDMRTIALAKPSVNFNTMSFKDGFSYSYEVVDEDQISTLDSIKLYYNGALVNAESIENRYSELFSDNAYELVVNLLCDYKDGKQPKLEEYRTSVVTLPLEDIEFNVTATADKTSIKYDYKMIDADNVGTIKEVRLYLDGELVATNKDITVKEFNDVLSDNNYVVAYVVEKNFRDNDIVFEEEFFTSVTTDYYNTPSAELSFTSTAEAIDVTVTKYDIDSILKLNKLSIYKGNTLVNVVESFNDLLISNLESNTVYRFVLEYEYDLNNGDGLHVETVEEVYSTLAYNVSVSGFEVLNSEAVKTNEEVNIRVYLENRSKVKVSYIVVNNERITLSGGDKVNNVIFTLRAPNKSGVLNINIQKMGYILNGIEVEQLVEGENTLQIPVLSRLDIVSISTVNGSSIYKQHNGDGYVIEIDNPEGYVIKELYLQEYSWITPKAIRVEHITNNLLYININSDGSRIMLDNYCSINGLMYTDEKGFDVVRYFNQTFNLNILYLDIDYNTYTLVTHYISTPQELLSAIPGNYYELANDIDMTGYNWVPNSGAVINGKGHKIQNLTYIHEDEYNYGVTDIRIGDIFSNVYFENVYINVESNRSISCQLFLNENLENVFISGSINLNNNNNNDSVLYISTNNSDAYIVGELNYNGRKYNNNNIISAETFESEEFRVNTLGWDFVDVNVYEENGYRYTVLYNSYVVINKYFGNESAIVIPEKINNMPVVGIEDLAFEDNINIKSIEFPSHLKYIGGSVLKGCRSIESIKLSNAYNILSINDRALEYIFGKVEFVGSYYAESYYVPYTLKKLSFSDDRLYEENYFTISLNYLSSLEEVHFNLDLGTIVLSEAESLKVLELPNKLNSLDIQRLGYLKELNIPEGLEYLSIYEIYVEKLYIPAKIRDLVNIYYEAQNIFYKGNLEEFINDAPKYSNNKQGIGYHTSNIYYNSNNEYVKFVDIVIPKHITTIQRGVFTRITSIKTISFEEGSLLQSLEDGSFNECWDLTTVNLPDGIKNIEGAFFGCHNLKNINIPDSVTSIGPNTFNNCRGLESIILPDNIETIGRGAFYYCESLTQINLPINLKIIGNEAFEGCSNLTTIDIPDEVEQIEHHAFANCYNLTSVTIPDSVIEIGENAFSHCQKLSKLDLGKGVKKIGNYAFEWCNSIRNLVIPNNVTEIGYGAFNCLNKMTSLTLSSNLKVIEEYAFGSCNSLESLVIPEGVIEIKANAFNTSNLKTLSLPSTLEKIGESAFADNNLVELNMPKNLKEIGYAAFHGSWYLTKLVLNEGLLSINTSAFMGCESLTSVTIPSSVQYIGSNAFAQNTVGNLTIYCNVATRPDGWERDWSMNCNVIWKQ